MTQDTPRLENPLHGVISQLRNISEDRDLLESTIDAGSLKRIAVHITNINSSVTASTQDHANASKRLNDFASALARIAKNAALPNEALSNRMHLIGARLRSVSQDLAGADRVPDWTTAN
jgi:hypothetical protein